MKSQDKFFEVKPGFDAIRYVAAFSAATLLAKGIRSRRHRFFQQGVGSIDKHIITEGYFEKGALEALRMIIEQIGCRKLMLDIGGNIGNHAVALSDLFERVETFEPHPVLFKVLSANIAVNQADNVTPHNFGLGNENIEATLVESKVEHGLSKIADRSQLDDDVFEFDETDNRKTFTVQVKKADQALKPFANMMSEAFVKVDVEGMEQEILESMEGLIRAHRPVVSFEWFTKEQPGLLDFAQNLPDYTLYGVRCRDEGANKLVRIFKLLFAGRYYEFERVKPDELAPVYTLAVLVPDEATEKLDR